MIYIRPLLKKANKSSSDFISYVCDERKKLGLEQHKGKNLIKIERNGGGGSEIHISEDLEPILKKFLNEKP